ncbi:MAG: hypothetical protein V4631_04490 [Pseudomonadota bacterium]
MTLHVAGVLCWPKRGMDTAGPARARQMEIAFVKLAPALAPAPAGTQPVPPRQRPLRPSTRAIRLIAAPPAPMEAVAPEETPAAPQKSAEDILAQAKRDVGKIDRDLRKASLDMALRNLVIGPTRSELLIGAAFKERGPPRIVEEVMSDGRRRSRVGNSCAVMESNGLVGARDVFRDGVKTKWSRC